MVREGYMDPIHQMFDEREKEERMISQPAKKVKAQMRAKDTDEWLLVPAMAVWIVSITFLAATF